MDVNLQYVCVCVPLLSLGIPWLLMENLINHNVVIPRTAQETHSWLEGIYGTDKKFHIKGEFI